MKTLTLTLILAAYALAQTPAPAPAPTPFLTDPTTITTAMYLMSQVADSTTDWKFTVAGKHYSVSPLQRSMFAGATTFGAVAVGHYFPRFRKPVSIGLAIGSAILAGRAYGHTLHQGVPVAAPVSAAAVVAR